MESLLGKDTLKIEVATEALQRRVGTGVGGGGGATATPLPLLHLDPVSSIRGKATARPPPWAPSAHAASPCAKLAAHPSAELVARGRGWGEDVVGGGGRGGKEGGLGWGKI
uniref:Uncharacterized protein n=1 Tax=Oryza nivara TaxID=4536 RepID=A0A0E0H7P2_ORYNI